MIQTLITIRLWKHLKYTGRYYIIFNVFASSRHEISKYVVCWYAYKKKKIIKTCVAMSPDNPPLCYWWLSAVFIVRNGSTLGFGHVSDNAASTTTRLISMGSCSDIARWIPHWRGLGCLWLTKFHFHLIKQIIYVFIIHIKRLLSPLCTDKKVWLVKNDLQWLAGALLTFVCFPWLGKVQLTTANLSSMAHRILMLGKIFYQLKVALGIKIRDIGFFVNKGKQFDKRLLGQD